MSSSIVRFPKSTPIVYLTVLAKTIEYGFKTAGVTAASYVAIQSLVIVSGWIRAL